MTRRRPSFPALLALSMTVLSVAGAHAAAPPLERRVLNSGAVLLASKQPSLPLIDIEIRIDAGSRRDPRGREGLANLTANLLNEGTARYSSTALAEAVDQLGIQLSAGAGIDSAYLQLRVLRDDLDAGLELLAEVLLRPTFPAAELERRRAAILAGMRASEDRPGHVAYREFIDHVFNGEPYGHLVEGTSASVAAISGADVRAFYRQHYTPSGAIITVVGDTDAADIGSRLERILAGWQAAEAQPFVYPEATQRKPGVRVVKKPLSQTSIVIGHRGIARSNPDYFAVEVMNHILGGGGFGSRLMDNVRTEAGLAYSVGSGFSTPLAPGSFRVTMQTKKESTREALQRTCRELLRIRDEPVAAAELDAAKLYLTGNFPLQLDGNRKIAGFLAEQELYALGDDYAATYIRSISAVSADDVQRVAQKHIRPSELHLVMVGDVTWEANDSFDCVALSGDDAGT